MSRTRSRDVDERPGRPRRLDYVCLQPIVEGQAGYAHVNEIVAGLRRLGWDVRLVQPPEPRRGRLDGIRRAAALATSQLRYWLSCRFRPAPFVYLRDHVAALPTATLARAAGSIVVVEVNGPLDDIFDAWPGLRPLHRLLRGSMRTQLRWADAVITVTPGLAAYVEGLTGRRGGLHTVGNGADVDRFRPSADGSAAPAPLGRPYVAFAGVLASWQGIDVALDALDDPAWPAGVDLVVAGDGRERRRVEAAARRDDRVRWLGAIPYRSSAAVVGGSLAALVPKADAPAARYGLSPLKLYEAMACGVPVVASDLPGLGEVIRAHGCGLAFPAGDAAALARCVAELAGDPVRARDMGRRGRDAAVAGYSWDARAAQTERVLLCAAGASVASDPAAGTPSGGGQPGPADPLAGRSRDRSSGVRT